jgi:hypothetical protein
MLRAAPHAPGAVLERDSEVRRFMHEDLEAHYHELRTWLTGYTHELCEQGLISDVLAPTYLVDAWRARLESAAEDAFR